MELERADVSRLKATGWKPVIPFSVKAHDGKTDIYGLMFVPTNLDPNKKYPVIDYIYPGPQGGSVGGNWGFSASRGDNQALAELGFVVVLIEGTGNPDRSKSFHDMYYPDMSINTLPDQVTGIRQLAARYPYMDTTRVGIWGHSGGGFATACAMFRYPDFSKWEFLNLEIMITEITKMTGANDISGCLQKTPMEPIIIQRRPTRRMQKT